MGFDGFGEKSEERVKFAVSMITIFSNPRPFQGSFDIIQRNAIQSWLKIQPKCEIILFNDEENTTIKVAKEFGLKCITDSVRNEFGTPLLNDVFQKIREQAGNEILAQVNADIILMPNFSRELIRAKDILGIKPFFIVGRRWDCDIKEKINFEESDWEKKIKEKVQKQGKLHGFSGMDYWVFPTNFQFNPPLFAVGRPGMDSWLIFKARAMKIPVIDATESIFIIHQNHNYPRKKSDFFEVEKKRNLELAGGFNQMGTLRDADWVFEPGGLKKKKFPENIFPTFTLFYPWRLLLSIKRKIYLLLK